MNEIVVAITKKVCASQSLQNTVFCFQQFLIPGNCYCNIDLICLEVVSSFKCFVVYLIMKKHILQKHNSIFVFLKQCCATGGPQARCGPSRSYGFQHGHCYPHCFSVAAARVSGLPPTPSSSFCFLPPPLPQAEGACDQCLGVKQGHWWKETFFFFLVTVNPSQRVGRRIASYSILTVQTTFFRKFSL